MSLAFLLTTLVVVVTPGTAWWCTRSPPDRPTAAGRASPPRSAAPSAMIAALAAHMPGALVHGTAAGLHLTVTYTACHPLSWHRRLPGRPGLVLGCAAAPTSVIGEGVAVLGEALREPA